MRRSWLMLLMVSAIMLGSGSWLLLESTAVIRLAQVRKVCSAIQKPGIMWAMTNNGCHGIVMWEPWEEMWEARLVAIGLTVTVLGMIGSSMAARHRLRRGSNESAESQIQMPSHVSPMSGSDETPNIEN